MNRFFNRFFTMPKTFGQWLAELLGGVFLALSALFLIRFLSPPLPFYSPHCATNLHNPADHGALLALTRTGITSTVGGVGGQNGFFVRTEPFDLNMGNGPIKRIILPGFAGDPLITPAHPVKHLNILVGIFLIDQDAIDTAIWA